MSHPSCSAPAFNSAVCYLSPTAPLDFAVGYFSGFGDLPHTVAARVLKSGLISLLNWDCTSSERSSEEGVKQGGRKKVWENGYDQTDMLNMKNPQRWSLPALFPFTLSASFFLYPSASLNGNYTFPSLHLSASSFFRNVSVDSCLSASRKPQKRTDGGLTVEKLEQCCRATCRGDQHVRKLILIGAHLRTVSQQHRDRERLIENVEPHLQWVQQPSWKRSHIFIISVLALPGK